MSPTAALQGYLALLHLLVVAALFRGGSGHIAEQVVVVSLIPIVLGARYLLGRMTKPMTILDMAVLAYAIWSLMSFVLYLQPGNPTQPLAWVYGFYSFAVPIAGYFAVKEVPRAEHGRIISAMVFLGAFTLVYGMYLYFARPDQYLNYLAARLGATGAVEEWQLFARMQSYLGSTSVGYIAATSIVLVTMATVRVQRVLVPIVLIGIGGAVLSLQRASFIGMALGLAYLLFTHRKNPRLYMVAGAAVFGLAVYGVSLLGSTDEGLQQRIQTRATADMVEGIEELSDDRGYGPGLWYLSRFPLGVGLGGTSSAAHTAGLVSAGEVADANFMRIAADLGVFGALLFLSILALAVMRALNSPTRWAWLTILMIHCGIMITTNIMDAYYISHAFWMLIAMMDTDYNRAADAVGSPGKRPLSTLATYRPEQGTN